MVAPWFIVLVLCGVAMQSMQVCIERAHFLSAWHGMASTAQTEIRLHRAWYGRGPEESDIEALRPTIEYRGGASAYSSPLPDLSVLQIRDGSFNLRLVAKHLSGNLTWLLARPEGGATLYWICGYARGPAGVTPPALANLTDVPPLWLPASCRNLP